MVYFLKKYGLYVCCICTVSIVIVRQIQKFSEWPSPKFCLISFSSYYFMKKRDLLQSYTFTMWLTITSFHLSGKSFPYYFTKALSYYPPDCSQNVVFISCKIWIQKESDLFRVIAFLSSFLCFIMFSHYPNFVSC